MKICCKPADGGLGGFEVAGQGVEQRVFGELEFGRGGWLGADAVEFEHELFGGGGGDVGADLGPGVEGAAGAVEEEAGACAVGVAVFFAEVHVDAAGEETAEHVVHDEDGGIVGRGAGNAEAEGVESGLGRAGLVDDDDLAGWAGWVREATAAAVDAGSGPACRSIFRRGVWPRLR